MFARIVAATATPADAELFRAQMLTEMAAMSLDDGLVMQIHPGSFRNHNTQLFASFGRDMGADIPPPTDYVRALKPLLDRFGNEPNCTLILFTLDETSLRARARAACRALSGLKLGPAWWFFDARRACAVSASSPRKRPASTTLSASTTTRAPYLSIPARHDVARRVDCAFLAAS